MAINAKCQTADLVLVGSFGCHPYMNPDWVSNNLLQGSPERPVKININLDGMSLEPSFEANANGVIINISRSRLVIRRDPFSVEAFDEIERIVQMLSELLPHTACTAMGVNFGFVECNLSDGKGIIRPIDVLCVKGDGCPRSLSASYRLTDVDTLNIVMKQSSEEGSGCEISFNFDTRIIAKGIAPLIVAKNKLIERPMSECYKESLSVLGIEG